MVIKLSSFSEQGLVQFLQSHQESQLSLKVNLKSNQDISYLRIIEDQFSQLNHLTEFSLIIPRYCVLSERGYTHISNAIKHLTQLTILSINITSFIQNQEFRLLKNSIQSLANLETLIFKVFPLNSLSSQTGQEFLDSLSSCFNLRKFTLSFQKIKKVQMNEGNIHFWRGIQSLQNLEKLALQLEYDNYGQQDLQELFSCIIDLKKLKRFSLITNEEHPSIESMDLIISSIGQLTNLSSLEIEFDEQAEIYLNETQRKEILKNLSNLRYLEKLKMKMFEKQLIQHHLKEYADLIGTMKYFKKLNVELNSSDISEIKLLNNLSQNFLNLANITNLELNFRQIPVYNEFISDLSSSLQNMKNLSTLQLFLGELNSSQSTHLGLSLNQLHNLTVLLIESQDFDNDETSSLIFQYLDGGFVNLKQLTLRVNRYVNCSFYLFLHKLEKLEYLEISKIGLRREEDFLLLNQALRDLKLLKVLNTRLEIPNFYDQSIQILESTFKELESLESLIISLDIFNQSDGITKMNILEHLSNLKKLSIDLNCSLNVFCFSTSSQTNQHILEEVEVLFRKDQTESMLDMIDSLSNNFPQIKKLTLKTELNDYSTHAKYAKEFSQICSRFTNLSSLTLQDESGVSLTSFYSKGIKKLKDLKQFKLTNKILIKQDIRQLGKALQKLENLRKIEINSKLDENKIIKLQQELSEVLHYHKKIKEISINSRTKEKLDQRLINTVSLNEELNEVGNLPIEFQNQMVFNSQKRVEEEQLLQPKEEKQSNIVTLFPLELKVALIKEDEEHLFLINKNSNIELKYLINLEIRASVLGEYECTYELSVKNLTTQLNQLSQLRYLTLELFYLSFTEELIISLSQNIRHLINLKNLYIQINQVDDHYCAFFDELKHLKELYKFELKTDISERPIISLGNSLIELTNLQVCTLRFNKKSQFSTQGVLSIFNGLKNLRNLEKVILHLISQEPMNENSQENDELISEFFEKMNKLYHFEIKMNIRNKEQNFFELHSSLRQLPSLEILSIGLSKYHPVNQEQLNLLINSINQLPHLRSIELSIFFQSSDNSNNQICIPQALSCYFNKYIDKLLTIRDNYSYIELLQRGNFSFRIGSNNIENTKLDFMDDLDENQSIRFVCSKSYILTILAQIERCKAKKIRLQEINIKEEKDTNDFCLFVSKIRNVSVLQINISISETIIEESLSQIANVILTLKSLHTLSLDLRTKDYTKTHYLGNVCSKKHLNQLLSKIQNLEKLCEFYVNSNYVDSQRIIQKKMKKLVKFDAYDQKNLNI